MLGLRLLAKQRAGAASRLLRSLSTTAKPKRAGSVFVTNATGRHGNSPVVLGLLNHFLRTVPSVGFFQPIGASPLPASAGAYAGVPKHVALVRERFGLTSTPAESQYGVTEEEARELALAGKHDELVDRIYEAYASYSEGRDVVVIEGATVDALGRPSSWNARLASELDSPVLLVLDVDRDATGSAKEIADRALFLAAELKALKADVLGAVVNKVPGGLLPSIKAGLAEALPAGGLPLLGALPFDRFLGTPRLDEIAAELGAELVGGSKAAVDADVTGIMVASQGVPQFLSKLSKLEAVRNSEGQNFFKPLVITSIDREDIVLGLRAASQANVGPRIGGVLLADSELGDLSESAKAVLEATPDAGFPVLRVPTGVYETARRATAVDAGILPTSAAKFERALEVFESGVDAEAVAAQVAAPRASGKLTPQMFTHGIAAICRSDTQHVVLPESGDRRVLEAAADVTAKRLAKVTLLGDPAKIAADAASYGVDLTGVEVEDFLAPSERRERYADLLVEWRKAKGLTREQALDALADMNMYGTVMVRAGDADGMVSGAACTTANTIRPALQILKTPDRQLVSSVFFMCLPDKVLVYGDCAVVVDPKPEELAQIAIVSAGTAAAFGIEPRVALLSYSTLGSGSGPAVDKVQAAVDFARSARPDLAIEGPIQYDAAVDPGVAAKKIKNGSAVAGKTTVCVFPDLNTGNNTYKAVQQSTGAIAIGPLMQGLARPVNDLSRGCTVPDIVNTVACTAVQALALKKSGVEAV